MPKPKLKLRIAAAAAIMSVSKDHEQELLGLIANSFKSFHYLQSLPYRWDREKRVPYVTTTKSGKFMWLANFALSLVLFLHSAMQFVRSVVEESALKTIIYQGLVLPILGTVLYYLHYPTMRKRHEVVNLMRLATTFFCTQKTSLKEHEKVKTAGEMEIQKLETANRRLKHRPLKMDNPDIIIVVPLDDPRPTALLEQRLHKKMGTRKTKLEEVREDKESSRKAKSGATQDADLSRANIDEGLKRKRSKMAQRQCWVLKAITISVAVDAGLFLAMLISKRSSPQNFLSYANYVEDITTKIAIYAGVLINYVWYFTTLVAGVALMCAILLTCIMWILQLIAEQEPELQSGESVARQIERYLELMVFKKCLNEVVSDFMPPAMTVIITPTTLAIYGIFKLTGIASLLCVIFAITTTSVLCGFIYFLGEVETKVDQWRQDIRRAAATSGSGRDPYVKRRLRVIRPIRAKVCGMFYIDQPLALTVLSIIIQNGITVLLL